MLMAGSELGLRIDVHGIHITSLAARLRTATWSNAVADGFAKIQAARSSDQVAFHAVSTPWRKAMLHRSMTYSIVDAHNLVCQLDRSSAIMGSPPHVVQRAATTLLCEVDQQRDLSRSLAKRATEISGPISRHRIGASSSRHPHCKSRHSPRIGLIMCNGLCTSRRFHVDDDQGCRPGCHGQPDCLLSTNVHAWQLFLSIPGDTQAFDYVTSFSGTTSSQKLLVLFFNMGS